MQDGANVPEVMPVPPRAEAGPAARWRAGVLLAIGGGVGLVLGILLTVSVSATYRFFTPTLPFTQDSVQVFNELNELRQQINRVNEERKLKDQENLEAVRQALSAVTATVRPGDSATPGAVAADKEQSGSAGKPPVRKPWDPLADVDEEIKRLEDTQKVLNTILDLFTPKAKERTTDRTGGADKGKERATDRPGGAGPPE